MDAKNVPILPEPGRKARVDAFPAPADADLRLQAHLLDAIGQAVVATRPDGTIIYWNRTAEQVYGWHADEVLGRNAGEVLVDVADRVQGSTIMAALRRGAPWSGEFAVRRKDGTTFPVLVTDTPMVDPDGTLTAIIGVSVDMTERARDGSTPLSGQRPGCDQRCRRGHGLILPDHVLEQGRRADLRVEGG